MFRFLSVVAFAIPFLFVIALVGMKFLNERKTRELQHETIRLALEKGQPLPAELFNLKTGNREKPKSNDRRTGLILVAVGAGLYLFLGELKDPAVRWVALIPGLIGVALLSNWVLERRTNGDEQA